MPSKDSDLLAEAKREQRTGLCALLACALLMITLVCVASQIGDVTEDKNLRGPKVFCEKARVLVTGFESFTEVPNPSRAAALSLNGTCGDRYCVESKIIPVDTEGAQWAASRVQDYAAILHLGLEDSAKGLKIEIAAKNVIGSRLNDPSYADCDGQTHTAVADAPCLQVTTAPLDRMLLTTPIDEIWSRDPGAFFCNECYFRTLTAVRTNHLTVPTPTCIKRRFAKTVKVAPALIPVLFVHLPDPALLSFDKIVLPFLKQILDVLGDPPLAADLNSVSIAQLGIVS